MWSIANYVMCLPRLRRDHLREITATCRNAMAELPHDHCANFLAHVQAEAFALLGDTRAFLDTWSAYESYFARTLAPHEYFKADRRYLLGEIPTIARLLQQNQTRLYRRAVRELRWKADLGIALPYELVHPLTEIPWWAWLAILFSLMSLIGQGFDTAQK